MQISFFRLLPGRGAIASQVFRLRSALAQRDEIEKWIQEKLAKFFVTNDERNSAAEGKFNPPKLRIVETQTIHIQ